ncbi:long-chain fatty acid--CoA ligase [Leucobacter albus]|uniref:Long-chain fatty acid--CoA ligase n=1 Tax=Leucobacter albus TaxID=272210 RepID=A0ABW3TLD3_9MICO
MSVPLGKWVSIHALRTGDRPALVDVETDTSITFRELDERTTRLASALRERGVAAGDRVAVCALNSPAMLEILFAVAKLDAVTVLINHRLTATEINFILADSGATLAFASTPLQEAVIAATAGTSVTETIPLLTAAERRAGAQSEFEQLIDSGDPGAPLPEVDPDSAALLMYTSGTTGKPKGAVLSHANLFWVSLYHNSMETGLSPRDRNIVVAPMFHVGGLAVYTLATLYWGGSNYILEAFAPATWAAAVEKYACTKAFAVPTMWTAILRSGELDAHDTSSLNVAITGGAPCPIPVIEGLKAKGMAFIEGFGMTETAAAASSLSSEFITTKAGSIGKPSPNVDFRVVDKQGRDVEGDTVGELILRGPSVFSGYWNRPDANAESFRDGWFFTGDLARIDADGFYFLVDRKKDMVISGGENVYPIEVEQVLHTHDGITDVSVIGTPHDYWGEAVTAIIVSGGASNSEDLAASLDKHARTHLAGFKVPRRYFVVEALPLTATGKVRKVELREWVKELTPIGEPQ